VMGGRPFSLRSTFALSTHSLQIGSLMPLTVKDGTLLGWKLNMRLQETHIPTIDTKPIISHLSLGL